MRKPKARKPARKQEPEIPSIAEKVQFWEEQDRINQVLISRVIRQSKLLTDHIEAQADRNRVHDRALRQLKAPATNKLLSWVAIAIAMIAIGVALWT